MLSLHAKQCGERGSGCTHLKGSGRCTFFPLLHKAHVARLLQWIATGHILSTPLHLVLCSVPLCVCECVCTHTCTSLCVQKLRCADPPLKWFV